MTKIGRNASCPCGSGKKYKNCCLEKKSGTPVSQKLLIILLALMGLGGLAAVVSAIRSGEPETGPGQVWSEEHQHWH